MQPPLSKATGNRQTHNTKTRYRHRGTTQTESQPNRDRHTQEEALPLKTEQNSLPTQMIEENVSFNYSSRHIYTPLLPFRFSLNG
jgi:hypothetical protein